MKAGPVVRVELRHAERVDLILCVLARIIENRNEELGCAPGSVPFDSGELEALREFRLRIEEAKARANRI